MTGVVVRVHPSALGCSSEVRAPYLYTVGREFESHHPYCDRSIMAVHRIVGPIVRVRSTFHSGRRKADVHWTSCASPVTFISLRRLTGEDVALSRLKCRIVPGRSELILIAS